MKSYGWLLIRKGWYGYLFHYLLPDMSDSFKTINTPLGTDPVATTPNDTLNLTSSDGTVVITGDSATDTVNFSVGSFVNSQLSNYLLLSGGTLTGHLGLPAQFTSTDATISSGVFVGITDTTNPVTITLENEHLSNNSLIIVKDVSGTITNPITITCSSGQLIDGQTSVQITQPYGYYVFLSTSETLSVAIIGQSFSHPIVIKTADYTITYADDGKIFSNQGAATSVNLILPEAIPGVSFSIFVSETQTFSLTLPINSTMYIGTFTLDVTGVIFSDSRGSMMTIFGTKNGQYAVKEQTGIWEVLA